MPARKVITPGNRFGRLTIIEEVAPYRTPLKGVAMRKFKVRCDCGTIKEALLGAMMRGEAHSCGCLHKDRMSESHRIHGHTTGYGRTKEFQAWINMRNRCNKPSNKRYADYGGRGIRVCERWNHSFENFLSDVGLAPSPKHSIDRFPNNDGNYEPGNCRWATAAEQSMNKRNRKK